jgi:spore coat protein CotH
MNQFLLRGALVSLVGIVVARGSALPAAQFAKAPDAQAKLQAAVTRVYDPAVLHNIDIVIDAKDVAAIERRTDARVSCTFTYDGTTLKNVGIRQAGGSYHPYVGIRNKPTLSLRFDEFVPGQELFGLERMVLKNELQDLSFLNEHMTYEVFRRAGLAAPMTAHAVVRINGILNGVYVMREPVNKQFLTRNFGKAFSKGNLYEIDLGVVGDPMKSPSRVDLKDEKAESRTRADILALAEAVNASTSGDFVTRVAPRFDLDRYLAFYAVEAATSYFDGFSFHSNNSYMYFHPREGRFILIPHGADEAFWATGTPITRLESATQPPMSALARKVRAVPQLEARFLSEIARIGREPVWNRQALLARVAQVAKILATAQRTGRTATDLTRFERHRPVVEAFINAGGTTNGTSRLPR